MNNSNPHKRLLSLDALRGFDMLFIMGGASLVTALAALAPDSAIMQWLSEQMHHVSWDGFAHHDTIFPLFLFIAGLSFPFSLAKQRESGVPDKKICLKVIRRALTLVVLGLIYGGLLKFEFDTFRIPSVLGRIGLAWLFAAMLFMWLSTRTRIIVALLILAGYSLLLLIPAPDAAGADIWSREGNICGYIDRLILGSHIYKQKALDPEGILSTLPAIVTAMLGMFTGEFIARKTMSESRKAVYMVIGAAILLVGGLILNEFQPINKTLWTSAFVLTAGAYSLFMFSLFYYVIDVRGWSRWCYFFKVIGVNSITIYMAQRIIGFKAATKFLFGGVAAYLPEAWGAVVLAAGYIAVCWVFLYLLDKKQIYLKV